MPLEELLAAVVISLVIGFLLGYYYVRPRLVSIEEKYRAELERWKTETESGIRKDSVNRSRSTLKGKIAEQMAPVLPEFSFNPADARFIGSPVDYVIFDGLTGVADEKTGSIRIVFMDVKQGKGSLTRTQRVIRQAVLEKSVAWETLHLPGGDKRDG
jgi:predicted Holliday junction resolvase-like endonuclease